MKSHMALMLCGLLWGCDSRPDQVVKVVDVHGKPIAQVRVQYNVDSAPNNPIAFTNQNGIARNPNRNFGTQYITASKAGFEDEWTQTTPKVWPIRIELKKK